MHLLSIYHHHGTHLSTKTLIRCSVLIKCCYNVLKRALIWNLSSKLCRVSWYYGCAFKIMLNMNSSICALCAQYPTFSDRTSINIRKTISLVVLLILPLTPWFCTQYLVLIHSTGLAMTLFNNTLKFMSKYLSPIQSRITTFMAGYGYGYGRGFCSLKRHRLTGIGFPIINPRRSNDRRGFIMGIHILIVNRRPG